MLMMNTPSGQAASRGMALLRALVAGFPRRGAGRLSWAGLSRALPGRCRTTNWSGYTSGRRRRGSVLVWLDREREGVAPKPGRPGRPRAVSEAAIRFGLRIEVLVGLARRPTFVMVARRLGRAGLDGPVPDRPALSRRQKTVSLPVPARRTEGRSPPAARQPRRRGRGEGEWPGRRHGSSRRQWRTGHRAMDAAAGEVRALEFTSRPPGDSPVWPGRLGQGPSRPAPRHRRGGWRW